MRIGLRLPLVFLIIFAAAFSPHAYSTPSKSFVSNFSLDSLVIKIVDNDIVELTVIVSGYNDTCTKHEDCNAENNMECDILGVCRCLNDYKRIDNKCSKNQIEAVSTYVGLIVIGILALLLCSTLIVYCYISMVESTCFKVYCRPYCCCCLRDEGVPPIGMGFRDLTEDVNVVHPVPVNFPVTIDVSVPPMHLTVNISAPTVVDAEDQPPSYDDLPPPFPQSPPPDYGAININFPGEIQNS